MQIFIYVIFYGALGYFIIRYRKKHQYQKSEMYFLSLCESVKKMNALTDQLHSIENMICDIEICNADHMKAVRIEIPDSLSRNASHEMLINGNDISSQYLLQLALAERDRLRSLLLDEVGKIARSAVTQTVTQSSQKPEQDSRGGEV